MTYGGSGPVWYQCDTAAAVAYLKIRYLPRVLFDLPYTRTTAPALLRSRTPRSRAIKRVYPPAVVFLGSIWPMILENRRGRPSAPTLPVMITRGAILFLVPVENVARAHERWQYYTYIGIYNIYDNIIPYDKS